MFKNEKVLYVIDMVNGFVKEGIMHDNYIAHTVESQIDLIGKFLKEKQIIALVKDTHLNNCIEFESFPPHCIKGSSEAQLIDEIKKYEKDSLVYEKNSTSAMYAPKLIEDLDKMDGLKEVVICGCCTDICVLNFAIPLKNYFNQNNKSIKIYVVKDATETYDSATHNREEYNEMAYKLMSQAGIKIVKNIDELEREEKENENI